MGTDISLQLVARKEPTKKDPTVFEVVNLTSSGKKLDFPYFRSSAAFNILQDGAENSAWDPPESLVKNYDKLDKRFKPITEEEVKSDTPIMGYWGQTYFTIQELRALIQKERASIYDYCAKNKDDVSEFDKDDMLSTVECLIENILKPAETMMRVLSYTETDIMETVQYDIDRSIILVAYDN